MAYQEAKGYFQSASFEKGLASLCCKQGELAYFQGDFNVANGYLNEAINYAKQTQSYSILKDIYQIKANIYSASRQSDSSFFALKNALYVIGRMMR